VVKRHRLELYDKHDKLIAQKIVLGEHAEDEFEDILGEWMEDYPEARTTNVVRLADQVR
jgi:hypothetical protein